MEKAPLADEGFLPQYIQGYDQLSAADRERLAEMFAELRGRNLPLPFVIASLRSTAEVLADLQADAADAGALFEREHVRAFIEQNAVTPPGRPERYTFRRERKREERDRLQATTQQLLREARLSRGRHEVKKTRNMLLKVDQRVLRRMLGHEGDDLCRQINTWLRTTAAMF